MSALQSNAARAMPVRPSAAVPQTEQSSRPKLRLVEAPVQGKSSTKFLMVCISFIAAAIVLVLVMNTEMANGAYDRAALQRERSAEVIVGEQLSEQLADISTAENLAKKAKALGMSQKVNPEVLHIDSKKVAAKKAAEEAKN